MNDSSKERRLVWYANEDQTNSISGPLGAANAGLREVDALVSYRLCDSPDHCFDGDGGEALRRKAVEFRADLNRVQKMLGALGDTARELDGVLKFNA